MSDDAPYPGWSPEQPPTGERAGNGWQAPDAAEGSGSGYPPAPPPPPAGAPGAGPTTPFAAPGWGGVPAAPMPPSGPPGWGPPLPAAAKPGVVPLRPLGLTEILDGAFTYIRRSPGVVLGIAAVVAVISNLAQFLINVSVLGSTESQLAALDETATAEDFFGAFGSLIGGSVVAGVVALVFQTVGTGLLTVVMGRAVLGESITAAQAWERGRGLILPLLGLTVLTSLLWGAGALLCLIPGVFLYVMWSLAPAALMLERGGVIASMRRSWRLVQGSWWRIFGILVLAAIIAGAVGQLILAPFGVAGVVIDGLDSEPGQGLPWATLALSSVGGIIATTITLPFSAGVIALLYVDQRMRREAFDLELARAGSTAGATPPAPPVNPPAPPAPPPGPTIH